DRWDLSAGFGEYDRTGATHRTTAWMCGRVTMEAYTAPKRSPMPRPSAPMARTDFVARKADSYGIAIDPSGKLNWPSNDIDGDHVITVVTQKVSDAYLAFLRAKGISYIVGGEKRVNLERVLEKLRALFGIRRLLLEGG